MLSTVDQVRQAQIESQQLYEQEMRARKIHVFVDLSNVSIGAQVFADGKRDVSVRINVPELVQCVYNGRDVKSRHLITSVADKGRQPAFIRDWEKLGYEVRVQERRGGSEQMLDEALMVPMQQAMIRFGSKDGAGPDQKHHTLVLLSGDGNRNDDHHSFAETIQDALRVGMFVEVWAWKNSVSKVYTQEFAQHYGGSFAVRYFDDYRDKIVRHSAGGAGVGAAAAAVDDDDDWMVCPLSCEVITDAAATKFAPKRYYERQSLQKWVQGCGTCPLTRKSCTLQVRASAVLVQPACPVSRVRRT